MKKYILLFTLLLPCVIYMSAQQVMVLITGATIHVGNGKVIENGYLAFGGGKIVLCDEQLKETYKNARVINATGKHVYPGIICMNTFVGLNEIDAVRATRDYHEVGGLNPNVRSLIAYNTDSKITPTVKSNGVLLVQVVPQGGLMSGSSSVMKTDGWNWEDAVYKTDDGIHIHWPEFVSWNPHERNEEEKRFEKELEGIEDLFAQAFQYSCIEKPEVTNVRFEAMRGLFNGTKKLYVEVNAAKGIISAVNFMKQYPAVKMVLVGAADSYKLTELIHSNNIPVVLSNIHRLPQRSGEHIDQPFKTPHDLMRAGITVAIGHEGSWESRNVMFEAGTAAAYGLIKEEALMCITSNPAKIMGLDQTCGTLEKGKDAFVIISSGDVLDMRTSVIEQAFILGEEVTLGNSQKDLYKKFMDKYRLK